MATKQLKPGQTIVTNDDDHVVPTYDTSVALAEFSPADRREGISLWRRAVAEVASGKRLPDRSVLKKVFEQAGGVGDCEAAFGSDLKDFRTVLAGEQAAETDAFGAFEREHGSRKDLMRQWNACHETLRTLKRLLAKHDALQRTFSLRVHQGECVRRANKRLWD